MEVTAKDWLDSLSAGTCEVNALLKGITDLLHRSPEEGWELLSIVDQYYRRGKISAPVFATLKAHLQALLMSKTRPQVSVPMPRSHNASTPLPGAGATTPIASSGEAPAVTSAGATPVALTAIAVGTVLRNRYRILGVLGHGGTGTVFEAVDLYRLDVDHGREKIAVKVLHPNVIRRPPLFTELRREFQRLQRLSHPNIVRVHEFDRDGETAFFTMEHLSGVLLSRVIAVRESAAVSREHAFAMVRDLCAAIGYAHGRGVVHGDVSPGNVFICNNGEVRVLDFGSNGVATPSFASCQVLEGMVPDVRDDVFGLACIAYLLLAGVHPFEEQTALIARAEKLKPKRPPGLDSRQWRALSAGLNFARDDRPSNVADWAASLNPEPSAQRLPALPAVMSAVDSRRVSLRWPALAALVLVIAGCGWWLTVHSDAVKLALARLGTSRPASAAEMTRQGPVAEAPAAGLAGAGQPGAALPGAGLPGDPPPGAVVTPDPVPAAAPLVTPPAVIQQGSAEELATTPPAVAAPTAATTPHAPAGPPVAPTNPGSRARLELTTDNVEAIPSEGLVRVMVRRTRSLRGDVSFNWWTESGTAKPGRDFTPVASHVEQIEDGKRAVNLVIPLIADPQRRQARSFYVVIDEADPTAAVGPRTLAMVTIPEPD